MLSEITSLEEGNAAQAFNIELSPFFGTRDQLLIGNLASIKAHTLDHFSSFQSQHPLGHYFKFFFVIDAGSIMILKEMVLIYM